jgi:hypothetical protein
MGYKPGTNDPALNYARRQARAARKWRQVVMPTGSEKYGTTGKLATSQLDFKAAKDAATAAQTAAENAEKQVGEINTAVADSKASADDSATSAKASADSSEESATSAQASAGSASATQKDLAAAKELTATSQASATAAQKSASDAASQVDSMSTIAQQTKDAAADSVPILNASQNLSASESNFAITTDWTTATSIEIPEIEGMAKVLVSVAALGAVAQGVAPRGVVARFAIDGTLVGAEMPLPLAGDGRNLPSKSIGSVRSLSMTAHCDMTPGQKLTLDLKADLAGDYPASENTAVSLMAHIDYRKEVTAQ